MAISRSNNAELVASLPKIKGQMLFDEPMAAHTSFKIGGPADIFAVASDISDVQALTAWADEHSVPIFVIGAGTNLLVSDRGFRGIIISLGGGFDSIHVLGTVLTAGASTRLAKIVRQALGRGLRGLEGVVGVPGQVGGAIRMNAGTHIGCIGDSLRSVKALNAQYEIVEVPAFELGLRYRGSNVSEMGLIIIEATFDLRMEQASDADEIIEALLQNRKTSQPIGTGSAGSAFKNPDDGYAGQLLDEAGAKGMQVGGARVSRKHANWIENTGIATADDVRELMNRLQALVKEKTGISLESEIEMIGEWE